MVAINEFLALFPNENTKKAYRAALMQFFDVVGVPQADYFNNGRQYENDIVAFMQDLERKGMAPKSVKSKVEGAVRSYLIDNNVVVQPRFWKRLNLTSEAITQDRLFTKEELRRIFSHLDIVGRSVASSEISNGIRLGDTLQVLLADLHLEKHPARFRYFNHKIRRWCIAFLTTEAKIIIEEWLKVRENWCLEHLWLSSVYHGWTDLGFEEWWQDKKRSKRLFPFEKSVFYDRWWEALDCAGLNERDPHTHRRTLHSQTFRKYFKSWAGTVLQEGVVEALIGHTGGLNDVRTTYNRYGSDCEEAMAQDFLKIEHLLTLGHIDNNEQKITNLEKTVELLLDMQDIKDRKLIEHMIAEKEAYEQYRQQLVDEVDAINEQHPPQRSKK